MNARAEGKWDNDDAVGSPGAPPMGRPLYRQSAHRLARMGFGSMLLLYFAGIVAAVSTFTMSPLGWRDAAGLFMMVVFPVVVAPNLRTWAIYGSVEGLQIVRWGRRRTVPWSSVGSAEYAWWSLNFAARVARLTLHEERERTILFFANDRTLKELEAMRALYGNG